MRLQAFSDSNQDSIGLFILTHTQKSTTFCRLLLCINILTLMSRSDTNCDSEQHLEQDLPMAVCVHTFWVSSLCNQWYGGGGGYRLDLYLPQG